MDNTNIFEKNEEYPERIKKLFKKLAPEDLYDTWSDTFDIDIIDEKHINIVYHGVQNIKRFKKECKEMISLCIYSSMGYKKKIKITKTKKSKSANAKIKKNLKAVKFFIIGMFFVCVATAIIIVLCNYIGNRNFRESFYSVSSIKLDQHIRVIQLSDLHGTSYGEDNKNLLDRIEALEPDIIICTGDIVNSTKEDIDYALKLGEALSQIAPSYYVYGNNETESIYDIPLNESELDKKFGFTDENRDETKLLELEDSFEEELEKAGIKVLKNEKDTIKIKNMNVDVYGVLTSNPSSFWSYSEKAFLDYLYENPDNIKITAVHEPFIFEEFNHDFWGDLSVCGHTHGGLMRVPVIGPLYTHEGGLFPERKGDFVYGRYNINDRPLIVSSGLENLNVLRINNQPELVVIDINKF